MLEEREAFLHAIFDTPDDDTPRLVYADWLEEHGFPDHAGLIRIQCELARREPGERPTPEQYQRQSELIRAVNAKELPAVTAAFPNRGFRFAEEVTFIAEELNNYQQLREAAAVSRPEWFGARRLRVTSGLLESQQQIATIFELPCFARIVELDLTGRAMVTIPPGQSVASAMRQLQRGEWQYIPVISLAGLERLVSHPGCERLESLTLTNNDLGNAAIPLLVNSSHLTRLRKLTIRLGNNLDGNGWQRLRDRLRGGGVRRLIERFGPAVVN